MTSIRAGDILVHANARVDLSADSCADDPAGSVESKQGTQAARSTYLVGGW
ncbi:MAG TPA: hypothetical protein VG104_12015 [Candidatus Dormibacteraeota bacterium]|jgi:hypothetical protein|nr:hypothetical protein [Candidatus Dormibacteraeota bacterium]